MIMNTWARMAGGDKNAFITLYVSHYQALFSYGFRLCADKELTKDCIQELFIEIWNSRPSLNTEIKNTRSYLYTWLRRKISRELSRMTKEQQSEGKADEFQIIELSYEELLIAFQGEEEKKEQLRAALKKLSKQQLEMIRLRYFENLSYRTIAAQTALTPRTVYNLVYEAMRNLRESLKVALVRIMF